MIFVVTVETDYEGGDVYGVWATREQAVEHANRLTKQHAGDHVSVTQWEVNQGFDYLELPDNEVYWCNRNHNSDTVVRK